MEASDWLTIGVLALAHSLRNRLYPQGGVASKLRGTLDFGSVPVRTCTRCDAPKPLFTWWTWKCRGCGTTLDVYGWIHDPPER